MIFFVFQAIRNACCSAAHLFGPVLGRFVYLVSFLALAFHCLLLWQAGGKTDRQTGSYPPPARPLTVNWCSPSNWDKCVINLPACLPACLPADIFAWLSPTSVELIWVKVFSYVQNFMTTLWLAFLSRWLRMQSKYLISVRSCCWLFNPQLPDSCSCWEGGGATDVRVRVALLQLTVQQFNSLVVIVLLLLLLPLPCWQLLAERIH